MPIRGAKVRRGKWFEDVVEFLVTAGFQSGAPGVYACPGFYFYSRSYPDGWAVVQIKPKMRLHLTFPNRSTAEYRDVVDLMNDLDSATSRTVEKATESVERIQNCRASRAVFGMS